jgi:hypothetical protein
MAWPAGMRKSQRRANVLRLAVNARHCAAPNRSTGRRSDHPLHNGARPRKALPSHVVLIELGADHAQPASQYRVVLPYGQLPSDTLVTDRGSRLHFLTGTSWHQLDMYDIPA